LIVEKRLLTVLGMPISTMSLHCNDVAANAGLGVMPKPIKLSNTDTTSTKVENLVVIEPPPLIVDR
jgi:hypothetical protein